MANWYIRESDLDEEYPPRPPFPFGLGSLTCDQITCLKRRLDSSLLVNGGPSTGKTVLAILQAMSLYREGSRCLYIASTSLSLKYAKHAFRTLGLPEQICSSYFEFERSSAKYEVILLDDSHQYSINQIKTLASASHFLLLYGDYSTFSVYETGNASLSEVVREIACDVFEFRIQYGAPSSFMELVNQHSVPITHHSLRESELPYVISINSIEGQCHVLEQIVNDFSLDDVGILCYTRSLVIKTYDVLNKNGFPVEAYLPGRDDEIDTIDLESGRPKIMTIASSRGIHFKNLFVLGFDAKTVRVNHQDALSTIVSRANEGLYIFYENQLPEPLASAPKELYKSSLHSDKSFDF